MSLGLFDDHLKCLKEWIYLKQLIIIQRLRICQFRRTNQIFNPFPICLVFVGLLFFILETIILQNNTTPCFNWSSNSILAQIFDVIIRVWMQNESSNAQQACFFLFFGISCNRIYFPGALQGNLSFLSFIFLEEKLQVIKSFYEVYQIGEQKGTFTTSP